MFGEKEAFNTEMYDKEDIQQVMGGVQTQEMFNEDMYSSADVKEVCAAPSDAALSLLNRQIRPGEQVLWQGKPLKYHRLGGMPSLLFGVFWLSFSLFWELTAMMSASVDFTLSGFDPSMLPFLLFGLPFVAVGVWLICPQLFMQGTLRKTAYAITDQRVIEVRRGKVTDWPVGTVKDVDKAYHKDGTADFVLYNGQMRRVKNSKGHYHNVPVTLILRGIPNADTVEQLLNLPK